MPIEQIHKTSQLTAEGRSNLTRRALAAWFSSPVAALHGTGKQPAQGRVVTKERLGDDGAPHYLHFAVVYSGAIVLAVYRAQPRGDSYSLRLMVRPPKDLVRLKGAPEGAAGNDAGNERKMK
jgi:hypothetical protein